MEEDRLKQTGTSFSPRHSISALGVDALGLEFSHESALIHRRSGRRYDRLVGPSDFWWFLI